MEGLSGKPSLSGEPFALDLFSSLSSYHLLFAVIFSLFWWWWGFSSDQRKIDLRCLWECGRSQHLQLFHSHLHNREKWWWQYLHIMMKCMSVCHNKLSLFRSMRLFVCSWRFSSLFPHFFYLCIMMKCTSFCHSWAGPHVRHEKRALRLDDPLKSRPAMA